MGGVAAGRHPAWRRACGEKLGGLRDFPLRNGTGSTARRQKTSSSDAATNPIVYAEVCKAGWSLSVYRELILADAAKINF